MTDTSLKCEICRKHDVSRKDYRFIDSCGLQGKVLACEWCYNLSDVAVSDIIRDSLDPKSFYDEEEDVWMSSLSPSSGLVESTKLN